jgi:hypothetical protein
VPEHGDGEEARCNRGEHEAPALVKGSPYAEADDPGVLTNEPAPSALSVADVGEMDASAVVGVDVSALYVWDMEVPGSAFRTYGSWALYIDAVDVGWVGGNPLGWWYLYVAA